MISKFNGGKLCMNPRFHQQNRKRYADGQDCRGQISNRSWQSERPVYVGDRQHAGHWEGGTLIGSNHKQTTVTVVERISGYSVIGKVANKTAYLVSVVIVRRRKHFGAKVKTLTFDNSKELCGYGKIDEALGCTSYFAMSFAFATWERGCNANLNGLLR